MTIMKYINKVIIIFVLPGYLGWVVSWAQPASFMAKRRQVLIKRQQQYKSKREAFKERISKEVSIAGSAAVSDESSEVQVSKTKPRVISECDCDDLNNPYNYAANFLYDAQKRKTHRINPYCKCKKPASSYIGIVPVTPSESEETTTWDIRY